MAIKSPLFIRVVPQDRARGYELLAGFTKTGLVKANATRQVTMSVLTRESLNAKIAQLEVDLHASSVTDVTPEGIKAQLRKLFGEANPEKTQPAKTA